MPTIHIYGPLVPTRLSRAYPWLLGSYVAALGATIFVGLNIAPRLASDAYELAVSAHALVDCAGDGAWTGCPGAARFGLLQNLVAIPLAFGGLSVFDIEMALVFVSMASAVTLLIVLERTFGVRSLRGRLAFLLVVAGPLIVYAALPFGEALQTLVFSSMAVAVLRNKRWAIVLLTALAAATRETAAVTVLPLALAAALTARGPIRGRVIAIATGLALGVGALGLFNVWKFGTASNPVYAQSMYVTPGLDLRTEMLGAVWFSPNGGVVAFWFVGAMVALGFSAAVLVDRASIARERWAAATLLIGVAVTSGGLALWYSPFGAVAWGPRLMIPAVMGTAIVALQLARASVRRLIHRFRGTITGWVAVSVATVGTVATALPSIGALVSGDLTMKFFAVPLTGVVGPCDVEVDTAQYFDCLRTGAWQSWPSQISIGLQAARSPVGIGLSLLLLALAAATFLPVAARGYAVPSMRLARSISLRRRKPSSRSAVSESAGRR